jgi:hypothetical protein
MCCSENQLQIPPQPMQYQASFPTLKHIIMGRMEYFWSQILDCATMWPSVEKLQVCGLHLFNIQNI